MSISVTCPECEHSFSVRDEYAGKRGKCPKCGGVFRAEPAEPAVSVGMPAALAARSGVSLGKPAASNGGFALDAAAPAAVPAPAGKKAAGGGGKKKKHGQGGGTPMPIWGWIALGAIAIGGFTGGGFVYMSRGNEAARIAENVDDGAEAKKIERELRDRVKELEGEIAALKTSLANAEKAIGTKPKEKAPLGEIEKRIIPGVVKVIPYVNDQPQQATASGFIVNDKQLVATTYQVCEGATKLVIKLPTGTEYEIEGIVAADEKQGVAILKPKGEMPGVQPLKLADSATVSRGDTVYAIGNPGKQEFTTSRGTITRVITQDQYLTEKPMFDVEFTRGSSTTTSFIEHDARIFPGDYGGPLLNENLDVVGMNQLLVTMVMNDGRTIVQTFGAAEEVKHVKALADKATDTIVPYPPAKPKKSGSGKPDDKKDEGKKDDEKKDDEKKDEEKKDEEKTEEPDAPQDEKKDDEKKDDAKPAADGLAGKIDALATECDGFEWQPKSEADYGKLSQIAQHITEAKNLDDDDDQQEAANASADKALEKLSEIEWESDAVEALNKQAAAASPKKDGGIVFAGTVKGAANFNNSPALMIQIDGSDKYALVLTEKAGETSPGSKWLLLGQYEADVSLNFNAPDGTKGTAYPVRSKVLITLD